MGTAFLYGQGGGGKIPDPKAGTTLYEWELWEYKEEGTTYTETKITTTLYLNDSYGCWDSKPDANLQTGYYIMKPYTRTIGAFMMPKGVFTIKKGGSPGYTPTDTTNIVYEIIGDRVNSGEFATYMASKWEIKGTSAYTPTNLVCSLYSLNASLTTAGVVLSTTTGTIQTIEGTSYYIKYNGAKTF